MKSKSRASSLREKRRIFGWLFLASILIFFVSIMLFTLTSMSSIEHAAPPQDIDSKQKKSTPVKPTPQLPSPSKRPSVFAPPDAAIIVSIVSLLTSITSLIGFFSTTVLAWRKEKRETLSAELEIKKKELELEKLRVELGKSGEGRNNKIV